MNQQREVIYTRRNHALKGEGITEDIQTMTEEVAEELVDNYTVAGEYPENWDWSGLKAEWFKIFVSELAISTDDVSGLDQKALYQLLVEEAVKRTEQKERMIGPDLMKDLERYSILRVIDEHWKDHLYEMDQLKGGIGLRAYGQKDPLVEYKREAFKTFTEMVSVLNKDALGIIFKAEIGGRMEPSRRAQPQPAVTEVHQSTAGMGLSTAQTEQEAARQGTTSAKPKPVRATPKVGRNDPCPCGSGKKYKKCHGLSA
jgi:preprotein translocase subunit SecA